MYDDTFKRIPTEGWMFLPLLNYEGGGPAAWFEPLSQNLQEYDFALAQYFGAGVQACYRGDRIFDSENTKKVVKSWIEFYKKYRTVLSGDLIHIRRADMQSIDGFLHVKPFDGHFRGLAMFFNPTTEIINDTIEIPLYYTGLTHDVLVTVQGNKSTTQKYTLSRQFTIEYYLSK